MMLHEALAGLLHIELIVHILVRVFISREYQLEFQSDKTFVLYSLQTKLTDQKLLP
jgi:hypothetical protein